MAHRPGHFDVLGTEGGRDYPGNSLLQLPGLRLAHAVAHEVDDASLPGGTLELLGDCSFQSLMGVGGDELHPVDAAFLDAPEEGRPGVKGLAVDNRGSQHVSPATLVAPYGHNHGCGGGMALSLLHLT